MTIPPVPDDAVAIVKRAFSDANRAVAERLCRLPNIWETSLDQTFIDALVGWGGPIETESGWTIRVETHFLGGGRHWGPEWEFDRRRWEIADIGVLVMFRNGAQLVRTKLALLQSKRLYPVEESIDEIELEDYMTGFYRLYESDAVASEASRPRTFRFDRESTYKMILVGDQQVGAIGQYESVRGVPVHYLLYNPAVIPWSQVYPLSPDVAIPSTVEVGCRVVPAAAMRGLLGKLSAGSSPSYGQLVECLPSPFGGPPNRAGRRVEDFVERLITCKEGYSTSDRNDNSLEYAFFRRGRPIAAAIGITISTPDRGDS